MKKIKLLSILASLCLSLFLVACGTNNSIVIKYESNGGTAFENVSVIKGEEITLPTPEKEGYTFVGWHTDEDLTSTALTNTATFEASTTLYASYLAKEFAVTIMNGESILDTYDVLYNQTLDMEEIELDGYIFGGLYVDSALTTAFDLATIITEDITLYAKLTEFALTNVGSVVSFNEIENASFTVTVNGTVVIENATTGVDLAQYLKENTNNTAKVSAVVNQKVIAETNNVFMPKYELNSVGFGSIYYVSEGEIYAKGLNNYGQLASGNVTNSDTFTAIESDLTFVQVASGNSHMLALSTEGDIYGAGSNEYGQLAQSTSVVAKNVLTKIESEYKFSYVYAGGNSSFAVTTTGLVFAFGENSFMQLGVNKAVRNVYELTAVETKEVIIDIAIGRNFTLFLTESATVYGVGGNFYGQLTNGKNADDYATTPSAVYEAELVKSEITESVLSIDAGDYTAVIQTAEGKFTAYGLNFSGQMGNNRDSVDYDSEVDLDNRGHYFEQTGTVLAIADEVIVDVRLGNGYTVALTQSGKVFLTGAYEFKINQQEIDKPLNYKVFTDLAIEGTVSEINASAHNIILTIDGGYQYLGNNTYGQI